MENIHIGFVNALDCPLTWVHAHRTDTENARQLHTITGFTEVDQFVVHTNRNRVGGLAGRNCVRCLLQLDDLLVLEGASVVNNLHRVLGVADRARAFSWLTNLATVKPDINGVVANIAAEEGVLHIGDHRSCSNDETLDTDQAVHVRWVQISQIRGLIETKWTNNVDG